MYKMTFYKQDIKIMHQCDLVTIKHYVDHVKELVAIKEEKNEGNAKKLNKIKKNILAVVATLVKSGGNLGLNWYEQYKIIEQQELNLMNL